MRPFITSSNPSGVADRRRYHACIIAVLYNPMISSISCNTACMHLGAHAARIITIFYNAAIGITSCNTAYIVGIGFHGIRIVAVFYDTAVIIPYDTSYIGVVD